MIPNGVVQSYCPVCGSLVTVQEVLGHEHLNTTEIYTHIDTAKWQESILRYHPER